MCVELSTRTYKTPGYQPRISTLTCVVCGSTFVARYKAKRFCSKSCHYKHDYQVQKTRQADQIKAKTTAHYGKTSAIGAQVVRMFELLPETERAAYAHWVLFLIQSGGRYAQLGKQWDVDDWLARYID